MLPSRNGGRHVPDGRAKMSWKLRRRWVFLLIGVCGGFAMLTSMESGITGGSRTKSTNAVCSIPLQACSTLFDEFVVRFRHRILDRGVVLCPARKHVTYQDCPAKRW